MLNRRNFLKAGLTLASTAALAACGGGSGTDAGSATASASADGAPDVASLDLVEEGKLTAVSDMSFPPLENLDGTTPVGYEIELVEAIADKLGLQMNWLPSTKFDTIIPLIKQGGKADIGASAFSITDERKEEIDFTDPILNSNQGVAVQVGSEYTTVDALNVEGVKVCAQSGTTGEAWIVENLPNATCVPLDDPVQGMTGVSTGLYDACVTDLPVEVDLCENSYDNLEVAIQIPTGEQYGIVVSKDNPDLTAAINWALAELDADGTIDDLQIKWFGEVQ